MAWVRYRHASVSASNPQALGTCDRCGMVYQHNKLTFQYDWRGPRLQNLRILVCPTCTDTPQQNGQRSIIIPPDPVPIINPRPDPHMFMGQSTDPNAFQFVAVGVSSDDAPSIMISPDGINWTETSPSDLSGIELFSVAYGNGVWVACGTLTSSPSPIILSSTDGVTWTQRSFPLVSNSTIYTVIYGGSRFIASSLDLDNEGCRIITSTDGVSWTLSSSISFAFIFGLAYGEGLYVACGAESGLIESVIYTSPDAVTWTKQLTAVIAFSTLKAVAYNGSMFAAVGHDDGSNVPLILTSTDGVTWTRPSYSFTGSTLLTAVTYANGVWVTVGGNETTGQGAVLFYSIDDGVSWVEGVGQVGVAGYPRGIASPNVSESVLSPFISVGGVNNPFVSVSNDGKTWSIFFTGAPSNAIYNAIAWGATG